jgi:hypothetical protein
MEMINRKVLLFSGCCNFEGDDFCALYGVDAVGARPNFDGVGPLCLPD